MESGCHKSQLRLLMFGEYPMKFVATLHPYVRGKSSHRRLPSTSARQ